MTSLFDPEDGHDVLDPKRRAFSKLHGVTTHITAFFIVTAVRTSNPVWKLIDLCRNKAANLSLHNVASPVLRSSARSPLPPCYLFRNACATCSVANLVFANVKRGVFTCTGLAIGLDKRLQNVTRQATRMLHNLTYPPCKRLFKLPHIAAGQDIPIG
jgi:hypothetical protein